MNKIEWYEYILACTYGIFHERLKIIQDQRVEHDTMKLEDMPLKNIKTLLEITTSTILDDSINPIIDLYINKNMSERRKLFLERNPTSRYCEMFTNPVYNKISWTRLYSIV